MKAIDADRLLEERRIHTYYHLPNGDIAIPLIDIKNAPTIEPEQHEIGYSECANAMLKMWIDKVLTDGEYNRIMDKLNAHWTERMEE